MSDIQTKLVKKCLVGKKTSKSRNAFKNRELHYATDPTYGTSRRMEDLRLLKAVGPHFICSNKPKNKKDLKIAMEDARSAYETMKEIQHQLNVAYKEIINNKIKL